MPSKVLIVDDSPHTRAAIRGALAREPRLATCGEAVDGLDALDKAETPILRQGTALAVPKAARIKVVLTTEGRIVRF